MLSPHLHDMRDIQPRAGTCGYRSVRYRRDRIRCPQQHCLHSPGRFGAGARRSGAELLSDLRAIQQEHCPGAGKLMAEMRQQHASIAIMMYEHKLMVIRASTSLLFEIMPTRNWEDGTHPRAVLAIPPRLASEMPECPGIEWRPSTRAALQEAGVLIVVDVDSAATEALRLQPLRKGCVHVSLSAHCVPMGTALAGLARILFFPAF